MTCRIVHVELLEFDFFIFRAFGGMTMAHPALINRCGIGSYVKWRMALTL